jgi:hypothetical protein
MNVGNPDRAIAAGVQDLDHQEHNAGTGDLKRFIARVVAWPEMESYCGRNPALRVLYRAP